MPSPTPEPVSDCENKPISFGCWKDSPLRAISGGIRFIPGDDPIEGCRKIALDRGYKVFAVQYGGECFTDGDAHQTYQKYGRSEDCSSDGRGGPWAQNVYQTDCSEGDVIVFIIGLFMILFIKLLYEQNPCYSEHLNIHTYRGSP